MYYAVGNITIKNITSGFDLSAENQRTGPYMYFYSKAFRVESTNSSALDFYHQPAIMKVFYSQPKTVCSYDSPYLYPNILIGRSLMETNSWGPIPFVLAYGESKAPDYPDGYYRKYLEENTTLDFKAGYSVLDAAVRASFEMTILD